MSEIHTTPETIASYFERPGGGLRWRVIRCADVTPRPGESTWTEVADDLTEQEASAMLERLSGDGDPRPCYAEPMGGLHSWVSDGAGGLVVEVEEPMEEEPAEVEAVRSVQVARASAEDAWQLLAAPSLAIADDAEAIGRAEGPEVIGGRCLWVLGTFGGDQHLRRIGFEWSFEAGAWWRPLYAGPLRSFAEPIAA